MRLIRILLLVQIFLILSVSTQNLKAQIIPVGSLEDEQLRLNMLLNDSLNYSSVNRPFSNIHYQNFIENNRSSDGWWNRRIGNEPILVAPGIKFGIRPPHIQSTVNSRFPMGENNQAAWYGRGLNNEFSGGFFLTSEYFTINIHPHIIHHENLDYLHPEFIFRDREGKIRYVAEDIEARLDKPFRFGPDPYTTFDWGNSSIRLHYNNFEAGLSTEPLWWGPANRYPLIMSNNASGIPHAFIATRSPLRSKYAGNFQFKWMVGYPGQSEFYDGAGRNETRFFNAINFAYSLPFYEQLTFGVTRAYHLYENDGFDIKNVLVIIDPLRRTRLVEVQGPDGQRQARNQIASVYFHLLLSNANAEIYGEVYREDHSFNFRDLLMQPLHNGAWMLGFQKLIFAPLADFYKVNMEITNLTMDQLHQVRPQVFLYTHSQIRQGHTNRGQLLGAAIGPGSSSQFLGIDGYRSDYKYGFFVQRIARNDDFHFRTNPPEISPSQNFGDFFRHWVDLNVGLNFMYGPGPYYLNAGVIWTKSFNYGRFNYGDLEGINQINYEREDRTNVQLQVGLRYVF